jgi:hypothetical protein
MLLAIYHVWAFQWVYFEEFADAAVFEIRYLALNAPLRVLLLVYLGMETKRVDRGKLPNVLKMRTKLRGGWKELL